MPKAWLKDCSSITDEYQHLSNEINLHDKINNLSHIGDYKNSAYS